MALSVCLLPDEAAGRAVRRVWQRLEEEGVRSLLSHTHGRHVPHLTLAALRTYDLDRVRSGLTALATAEPAVVPFDGLGVFRRSRCWLLPALTENLLARQAQVVTAAVAAGADLHRNYVPGTWMPHLTLAPRLHVQDLPTVARTVFDVLPLVVPFSRAGLVDTSTGHVDVLAHLV